MRTAMITGITGQDGCYLSKLLLKKGYRVIGLIDPLRKSSLNGLKHLEILKNVDFVPYDPFSYFSVQRVILENEPCEIYHLAGQSSVSRSFDMPAETMQFNATAILHILECVRKSSTEIRVYNASSSEMYGNVQVLPINEETPFSPISPYAVSKVAAHHSVKCFRESFDLFAVSGILFNHESILRRDHFFTHKLLNEAIQISSGQKEKITFGNLGVRRDIGFAPCYVETMWMMLQQDTPRDYLICSGRSVALKDLVDHVFKRLEIPGSSLQIDNNLFRPNEIQDIYGDNSRAIGELEWRYNLSAFQVIDRILDELMETN